MSMFVQLEACGTAAPLMCILRFALEGSVALVYAQVPCPAKDNRNTFGLMAVRKNAKDERVRRFIAQRVWPFLAGMGSAAVMLLAFLLPSLQDQWDRYKGREVVNAFVALGDTLMARDAFAQAEAAYDKANELASGSRLEIEVKRLEARVGRMSAMQEWSDSVAGDLDEVDFAFLLGLKGSTGVQRARILQAQARFFASRGQAAQAEAALSEALALSPNDAWLLVDQGNVLDQLGRKQEAEQAYRAAITHEPGMAQAHFDLGLLYAEQQQSSLALREMREALRLDPTDTVAAAYVRELEGAPAEAYP